MKPEWISNFQSISLTYVNQQLRLPAFVIVVVTCITGCAVSSNVTPIGTPGRKHISYATGGKFKGSEWSPAENETLLGFVEFDKRLDAFPAWIVAKLLVGSASEAPGFALDPNADSSGTSEFCLGLRSYGSIGRVEPFVSAGIGLLTAKVTGYDEGTYNAFGIDEGLSFGGWADAGIQIPLTTSFSLGLAIHHSIGSKIDIDSRSVQPGGTSLLITFGVRR